MVRLFTTVFQRYARWSSAHPAVPLAGIAIVTALCLVATQNIGLDASFEALLPDDTPSVLAREEARSRVGSSDLYLIAIGSPDPPANYRFAKAIAAQMETWPEVEWVMHSIDLQVFRDKALLFMTIEDLQQLVDLVELKVLRGQCEYQRNCNERDLRTDEERAEDDQRLKALSKRYQAQLQKTTGDRSALVKQHGDLGDAMMNEDGTVAVVAASLEGSSSDMAFAGRMLVRGQQLIEETDPSSYHPELIAEVRGAWGSSNEYVTVLRDATTASLISLTLVVLVVMVFLRRLTAVVIIASSLVVGIVWTMGFTAVSYPTLNTITVVIFGILLGMGIDYSIHYCVATRAARGDTTPLDQALSEAGEKCFPAMVTSALTTAAALLTLVAAHNRGFREFGLIGAAGVVLCLLSSLLVIPPLWGVVDRMKRDDRPLPVPRDHWMARRGTIIAICLGLGLCAALAWRAPMLEFEYNLSNLRARSVAKRGIAYGDAIRTGRGTSPAVLLGDSEEQLRRAHRFLTKRLEEGDDRIRDTITIETFIPPDQEAKLEEIERLRRILRPRTLRRVSEEHREDLERLARMAEVDEPLEVDDLPRWARQTITEQNGAIGRVGFLYAYLPGGDVRPVRSFQQEYESLDMGGERPVRVASSRFIVADVVYIMQDDGKLMSLCAVLAVVLLLFIDLRSVLGTLLCTSALILGLVWGFGAAGLLGWKLGVFNMLVIPVALGLGIDGTIHLYHRYKRSPAEFIESPLGATGLAVFASTVTTLAGFSGLLFVSHRGLATIGQLAVVTIGFTLLAVLGLLPGALLLFARRKVRKKQS